MFGLKRESLIIAAMGAALLALVAGLMLFGPATRAPAPAPRGAPAASTEAAARVEPSFIERFETLDEERWRISDGWSNGSWTSNDWRFSQLHLVPHGLDIVMGPSPPGSEKPLSSGELRTNAMYQYGYFEARMRVPRGAGVVTGLFTFTRDEAQRSTWNEVDIEWLGRSPRKMELTYHVGGRPRNTVIDLPFDASADFHTYGFEWRQDAIRWYVDNEMVHEERGGGVGDLIRPQHFFVNLWASTELSAWVGHLNPAQAPWTLSVACIAQAPAYDGRALCGESGTN